MDPNAFQPYQNQAYQAPTPWANANTYAPWDPDGAGGQSGDPSTNGANPFSGYGQTKDANYNVGGIYGASSLLGVLPALFGASQGWFGSGKKRPNITYSAPSYQGSLFTPAEGLPQTFGPSMEGGSANTDLMSMMGGQYGGSSGANVASAQGQTSPNMAGGFYGSASGIGGDYTGAMPSYIGQSPWASGYGTGYGSNGSGYGSYGSSGGTQSNQSNPYQPYVPMGGSGSGYGQY